MDQTIEREKLFFVKKLSDHFFLKERPEHKNMIMSMQKFNINLITYLATYKIDIFVYNKVSTLM